MGRIALEKQEMGFPLGQTTNSGCQLAAFWVTGSTDSTRVWECSSQVFQNGGQAMAANTAKGAGNKDTRTITFKSKEHKDFYK